MYLSPILNKWLKKSTLKYKLFAFNTNLNYNKLSFTCSKHPVQCSKLSVLNLNILFL